MPDGVPTIVQVAFGTPRYAAMTALRETVLRRPLGLVLTAADVAGEDQDIHIAALAGEEVIGTVLLRPRDAPTIKLRQMAVAEAARGTGLGAALVAYAESVALARDHRRIALNARRTATGFYERLGYAGYGEPFLEIGLPHIGMEKILPR